MEVNNVASDHKPSTLTIELAKNTETKAELGIEPCTLTTEVATATKNNGNKGIRIVRLFW